MTTRSAHRSIMARRAVDAREAVLFSEALMIEILGYCMSVDMRQTNLVCKAVSNLDFTWLINLEAERRFKQAFPYAHSLAVKHPNPRIKKETYWIYGYVLFRKEMKKLSPLTFKKNTRLAVARRSSQVQHTKLIFFLGKGLNMKVWFKNGFLQGLGMSWEVNASESNKFKYDHNAAQWLDVVNKSGSHPVLVTHIDRRPLSSFHGINEIFCFIESKKSMSFAVGLLAVPTGQWPLESRIGWHEDWASFNSRVLTI
jgi:hypothetical protein